MWNFFHGIFYPNWIGLTLVWGANTVWIWVTSCFANEWTGNIDTVISLLTRMSSIFTLILIDTLVRIVHYDTFCVAICVAGAGIEWGTNIVGISKTETFERPGNIVTWLVNGTGIRIITTLVVINTSIIRSLICHKTAVTSWASMGRLTRNWFGSRDINTDIFSFICMNIVANLGSWDTVVSICFAFINIPAAFFVALSHGNSIEKTVVSAP